VLKEFKAGPLLRRWNPRSDEDLTSRSSQYSGIKGREGATDYKTRKKVEMKNFNMTLSAVAIASALVLSACGGGGGGSSSASAPAPAPAAAQTVTGTLSTPQYAANSAKSAIFTTLNQYRQQCGFPALQENTVLDKATQAHAQYNGLNNLVTDTETAGNPGYTGATYLDRAVVAGFPAMASGWGVSGDYSTVTSGFSAQQAGQWEANEYLGGVYHVGAVMYPSNIVGIGEYETSLNSSGTPFTDSWDSLSLLNTSTQPLSNVTTFPCEGVTGVPYAANNEIPTPPNVSASGWGTPVILMRNVTDIIVLQTGTMTDTSGHVINLNLLDSANDSNHVLQPYQGVAYSSNPLTPNTTYSVAITGTINGQPFSSTFSFTTGNTLV
jgi:hypothetical protein